VDSTVDELAEALDEDKGGKPERFQVALSGR
jgi:hypothetical protein